MERSGVTSIVSTGSSSPWCTATQEMHPLISASLALFLSLYLTFLTLFASLAAASFACESSRATIVTVLSLLQVIGGLGESLTLISSLGFRSVSMLGQVVSGDFLSPFIWSTCCSSCTCLSFAMLPRATLRKWAKAVSWVLQRRHVSNLLLLDIEGPTTRATSSSSSSLSTGLRTARGNTVQQQPQIFPLRSIFFGGEGHSLCRSGVGHKAPC